MLARAAIIKEIRGELSPLDPGEDPDPWSPESVAARLVNPGSGAITL
jgi:hypothetical protein